MSFQTYGTTTFYHFLKTNNGTILQGQGRKASPVSWSPLDARYQVATTWKGHIPFSGFPASPAGRATATFPSQTGSQGQAGCQAPTNQNRLCICPTWDETKTKPTLAQSLWEAAGHPLSHLPHSSSFVRSTEAPSHCLPAGTPGDLPWDYSVSKSYRIFKNSFSCQVTKVYSSSLRPI